MNDLTSERAVEALPGLPRPESPHGRITALSMMKDEGPFVLEWVAHHLAVGFTDFVIYTNDCSDGTDAMLMRLDELGLVQHRENRVAKGMKPQPSALKYAQAEPAVAAADWLIALDADEFLGIRLGDGRLDGLLDAVTATGGTGIVLTWRVFGSAGIVEWSRQPVTEQYLRAAPLTWNKGWGVKTLFRFDPEVWKLGIHRPKMKNKVLETDFPDTVAWLNGSGAPMEDYFKFRGWRSIRRTVGYDWAQVNHYAVKSVDAYVMRRLRGNVNDKADKYNAGYWALQDRNEERDDLMLRYERARGAILGALRGDPVLARLERVALERAEARLADFRATPEYPELVARLAEAGRTPIGAVNAAPPKPRDPARIAASMSEIERRTVARAEAGRRAPPARGEPLYLTHVRPGAVASCEWCDSYGVALPVAPGVFTEAGLRLVRAGKVQRQLTRVLPGIAGAGARVLEIGAATGYLGLMLARARDDLLVTLAERDQGWAEVLDVVLARNAPDPARVTRDAGTPAEALAERTAPTLILIGDPALTADELALILGVSAPSAVILTGRLLEAPEDARARFAAICGTDGLGAGLPLDPAVAVGFTRG